MKIFLDTSSLFKLYHREIDSDAIESIFTKYRVTCIFLSELAKVEFASTVWKKVRTLHITEPQAEAVIKSFESDFSKYQFIRIDSILIENAKNLIMIYGGQGLRTLDSIQLSTAIILKGKSHLFISADKMLHSFFTLELLPTQVAGPES